MDKAEFLDGLITYYSNDEVYNLYELCIDYYKSVTGRELSPDTKEGLQDLIYQRPAPARIRDSVYILIDMFNQAE